MDRFQSVDLIFSEVPELQRLTPKTQALLRAKIAWFMAQERREYASQIQMELSNLRKKIDLLTPS